MKNQEEEEEEEESTSRWRRQRARATVEGVEHDATTVGVCFCCVCVCLDSCDVLYVYFVVGGLRWGGGVLFCCVDMWGWVMWWRCGVVLHSSAAADCCRCCLLWIFLHAALWPPAFQCTRWHAAPQYATLLHLLHRSSFGRPFAAAVFPQLAQRDGWMVLGIGGVEMVGADADGADGAGAAADAFGSGGCLRFCFGSR